mgnify:CR=1 FL=1
MSERVDELIKHFEDEDLMEDRREYALSDLLDAGYDLDDMEIIELYLKIQHHNTPLEEASLCIKLLSLEGRLPGMLHNELYPLEDSKRVFAGIYEVRTAILAKYIGMHEVLEALGCPALELSAALEEELSKLEASKK